VSGRGKTPAHLGWKTEIHQKRAGGPRGKEAGNEIGHKKKKAGAETKNNTTWKFEGRKTGWNRGGTMGTSQNRRGGRITGLGRVVENQGGVRRRGKKNTNGNGMVRGRNERKGTRAY